MNNYIRATLLLSFIFSFDTSATELKLVDAETVIPGSFTRKTTPEEIHQLGHTVSRLHELKDFHVDLNQFARDLEFFGKKRFPKRNLDSMRRANELYNHFFRLGAHFIIWMGTSIEDTALFPVQTSSSLISTRQITNDRISSLSPSWFIFQKLTNQLFYVLNELRHEKCPKNLNVGYLDYDDTIIPFYTDRNGYVVTTPCKKEGIQLCPSLYGETTDFQRYMVFDKGELVTDPGFMILPSIHGNLLKIAGYLGNDMNNPYSSFNLSYHIDLGHDSWLLSALKEAFETGDLSKIESGFIPLPASSEEEEILEYLFLELLSQEEDVHADTVELLEDAPQQEVREEPSQDKLKTQRERLLSKYEARIRQEQELRSRQQLSGDLLGVSYSSSKKKKNGKKKKKGNRGNQRRGKPQGKVSQSVNKETLELKLKGLAAKRLDGQLTNGRLKFSKLLPVLKALLAKAKSENPSISFKKNVTGSHIVYSAPGASPVTIVRPHGGKDEVWEGTVETVTKGLINMLIKNDQLSSGK